MRLLLSLTLIFSLFASNACGRIVKTDALPTPMQNGYFLNLDTIKVVSCHKKDGPHRGTGFVIGKNRLVTANHVVYMADKCNVDDQPVKLISNDEAMDIAVLEVNLGDNPPVNQISCEGFKEGHIYFSFGYSWAQDFAMEKLVSTGATEDYKDDDHIYATLPTWPKLATLTGFVFKGMSGGPIVDMDGRVVGINNITSDNGWIGSRALRDTKLCDALKSNDIPLYPPLPEIKVIGIDEILKLRH